MKVLNPLILFEVVFWRTHGIDCAYEPKRAQNDHISTQSWADWVGSKRWNAFFSVFKLNYGKKPFECTVLQLRGTKCGSYKQFWKLTIFELFWQNSNLLKIRPKFRRFPGIKKCATIRTDRSFRIKKNFKSETYSLFCGHLKWTSYLAQVCS